MNYTKVRVILYDSDGLPFQTDLSSLSILRRLNTISTGTIVLPNTRGQFDPDNPEREIDIFSGQRIDIQRIDYINGRMNIFDVFHGKIDQIGGMNYSDSEQTVTLSFTDFDAWKWAKTKKTTEYFASTTTKNILISILDNEGIKYNLYTAFSNVNGIQFVNESLLDIINSLAQVDFLAWSFDNKGLFKTYPIGAPIELEIPTFDVKSFSPADSQWDSYTEVDVKGKSKDELNQAQDFGEYTGTIAQNTTITVKYSEDNSIKAKEPVVNWITPEGFSDYTVENDISQTFCTVTINTNSSIDYDFTLSATVINRGDPFYGAKYVDPALEAQAGAKIPQSVTNHVITDNNVALRLAKKLLAFSKFKQHSYTCTIAGSPRYNDFLPGYALTLTHPKFGIPLPLILTDISVNFTSSNGFSTQFKGIKEGEWYA